MALIVPHYTTDEDMKKTRYHDTIARVQEHEIELQHRLKHEQEHIQIVMGKEKRPKS